MSAATAIAPDRRQTRPKLVPDTFQGTSGALFWRVVCRPISPYFRHIKKAEEVEVDTEKK